VDRFGVIGCGLKGSEITEVGARAGLEVLVERNEVALKNRRCRILASLDEARPAGKMSADDDAQATSKFRCSHRYGDLADLSFVIESVREDETIKLDVFRRLDEMVTGPAAIFASNTSSIPIATLASVTS
jgi:3-hydroxybutyryl-CoA dehydrogenase